MQPFSALVLLGRPSVDTYFQVPRLLTPGEKMPVDSVFLTPGGVAGNFAAHLASFGAAVTAFASPSADPNAAADIADLQRHGVELIFDESSRGAAHQCYIFLAADGQRGILIDEATDHDVVHAGLLRLLAANQLRFDAGYLGIWSPRHAELARATAHHTDHIAATIENSGWPADASPEQFANLSVLFTSDETFHAHPAEFAAIVAECDLELVVTHGKDGSEIHTRDRVHFAPAILDGAPIVDTTGAGDCFAAAYLWFHSQGLRESDLLHAANSAARAALATLGPRPA